MTKRRGFIIQSALLSLGLFLSTQIIDFNFRYLMIIVLSVAAYFMSYFSLQPDFKKIGWLMNLPLPALYTMAVAFFYFLLPQNWLSKIVILGLFSIGMYAILLIENIFNVSAYRTIQLLRAAQAIGFLFSLITAFLFFDLIFSFSLFPLFNAFFVFPISFLLVTPALWSVELKDNIEERVILFGLIISWLLSFLALVISFWPLDVNTSSLFLVSAVYVYLGLAQNHFSERLFKETLREYLGVAGAVLLIIYFLAHWG